MLPSCLNSKRIGSLKRTSPCRTSVLNLGMTPRVSSEAVGDGGVGLPKRRKGRNCRPSQTQAMRLISKCLSSNRRQSFEDTFQELVKKGKREGDVEICGTPIRWIRETLGNCEQLSVMSDMFPESGMQSCHPYDIYLMDVILNRSSEPAVAKGGTLDPDIVVPMRAFQPGDQDEKFDFVYRTMIAFLPGIGSFYCARERRRCDGGVDKSLVPHDMSWLRLKRDYDVDGMPFYTFGDGGFVRRLHSKSSGSNPVDNRRISVWRVSPGKLFDCETHRLMHRVAQCHDKDGPRMAPDVFAGEDVGKWPQEYLAHEYNQHLASSNSARSGGRHYAAACLHYSFPRTCWMLDPKEYPRLDLMVDVADHGHCTNRQTVVSIRNLINTTDGSAAFGSESHVVGNLNHVTFTNKLLRKRVLGRGTIRSAKGDVGTMHALGMRVELDGLTVSQYQTNQLVPEKLLRTYVSSLASIGNTCFPGVMPVIQDTEKDSGVDVLSVMEGLKSPDKPDEAPVNKHPLRRVGYTIDMSINLGNASHFDVHDASQGFSVWTEELRGLGYNWYFVMPNVYGRRPDGSIFSGIAVKLSYGVAISWDGRVLRHCTSISHPDGRPPDPENSGASPRVSSDCKQRFRNYLYGNFTSAKERIVQAGRARSAGAQESIKNVMEVDGNVEEDVSCNDQALTATDAVAPFLELLTVGDYSIPKKRKHH